jgi:indole-3-glycerol phosphate synthase
MGESDYLRDILARKRIEIERRRSHQRPKTSPATPERGRLALAALKRPPGSAPKIIGEIKRKSPSAGRLRPWQRGDVAWLATEYSAGGAAAISVLCDGPGFGGSILDLRRAARVTELPILFKEFVLDELQIELAQASGAHMVLLIVRALTPKRLQQLIERTLAKGLAPIVEAADSNELTIALNTPATVIGINARNLTTFKVDPEAANQALQTIPSDRIAVHMSGIRTPQDLTTIATGRADAVLIGETLMRSQSPASKLRELTGAQ